MNSKELIIAETEKRDKEQTNQFFKNFGLDARLISKAEVQTPDFGIYQNSNLFGYCELKSIIKEEWKNGTRKDPTYNRIQGKIHEAVKQLKTINAKHTVPNIIVIINHEEHCGKPDLHAVLTGKFLLTQGEVDFDARYRNRLLKNRDLSHPDLIVWIDADSILPHFYCLKESSYKQRIREVFTRHK